MAGKRCASDQSQLALALARGDSVAAWARDNQVPKTTAFRWARSPAVRLEVECCRRRIIDQAVGILVGHADWAREQIVTIAMRAESESVRLAACRAILSSRTGLCRFEKLDRRLAHIEEQIFGRAKSAIVSSESRKAGNRSNRKTRTSDRDVVISYPLVSGECRPTFARVLNRESGERENR
jgi:hypothetical protein